MLERLKRKWGIESNRDVVMIFLVFSLAGMSVSFCRRPIFAFFGVTPQAPFWLKACIYLPFVFPLYQVSLIVFGSLLGQFRFFWEKEKQLLRGMRGLFRKALRCFAP
ncbi:MAG: DUF6787 family protein [Candidatus Omnitrophota bacterium]|nr:DUF6787 family protein [Candidatus Omnitrophota bacterium]